MHDWIASGNVDQGKLSEELKKSGEFRLEDRPIGYLDGMPAYTDVLERHGYTCALSGKMASGRQPAPAAWIFQNGIQSDAAAAIICARIWWRTVSCIRKSGM